MNIDHDLADAQSITRTATHAIFHGRGWREEIPIDRVDVDTLEDEQAIRQARLDGDAVVITIAGREREPVVRSRPG